MSCCVLEAQYVDDQHHGTDVVPAIATVQSSSGLTGAQVKASWSHSDELACAGDESVAAIPAAAAAEPGKLDHDYVVLRGARDESAGQTLKGVISLQATTPARIKGLCLELIGTVRVPSARGIRLRVVNSLIRVGCRGPCFTTNETVEVIDRSWKPAPTWGTELTLHAGRYEFPFEFIFRGDAPETLTGVSEASVSYHLKATVAGTRLFQDMKCRKQLRVVRTPGPSAWTLFHATSQETTLLEKIRLTVALPQNAVLFGGYIAVQLRIVPLVKGLCPGEVAAQILETRECEVQRSTRGERQLHRTERVLGTWRWGEPDTWRASTDSTGAEGWDAAGRMGLPQKQSECVQDMNYSGTRIRMQTRHKVELRVAIAVENGRVFEIFGAMPFVVVVLPSLTFDQGGNVTSRPPEQGHAYQDYSMPAPRYGEHELDMLFEEK
ncbi:hypothetical protein PCL_08349 [Purpureocillium lilacinum]|uniref:Arrestin-like N-terminal domain-containing protein n=1 Tax=Purpureocillium lilacinum TaxID=33203 RepID=A0A2U3DRV3_PURLI|nr:hypothetical protein PCL_08349 [Purpureocillium lilacinum]